MKGFTTRIVSCDGTSFSILERIVCGEGAIICNFSPSSANLSVSSNGSCAVKDLIRNDKIEAERFFQYPRTDRVR